jgi:hypothetical protein
MSALCAPTKIDNMGRMSVWSRDSSQEDKLIAEKLVKLLQQIAVTPSPFEPQNRSAYESIRAIGKDLNENGSDDRMRRVADRVKAMGGDLQELEGCWSWIGAWRP